MNTSIYIDNDLLIRMTDYIEKTHMSRSALIREALNEWLDHHSQKYWEDGFFCFEGMDDFPLPEPLRKNLLAPKEDPFL